MSCFTMLPPRWICWRYLACLAPLISSIICKLKVCLLGCLVLGFKYKVNWRSGLPPKQTKICYITCGGVVGTSASIDQFLNMVFPRFLYSFFQSLQDCNYRPIRSLNSAITLGVISMKYFLVWSLFMLQSFGRCVNNLFSNSLPWSWRMLPGVPNPRM